MNSAYQEFALLLMLSAVVGAIAVRLRQPLLMAYIIVGILVGPSVFGWVGSHDHIVWFFHQSGAGPGLA